MGLLPSGSPAQDHAQPWMCFPRAYVPSPSSGDCTPVFLMEILLHMLSPGEGP